LTGLTGSGKTQLLRGLKAPVLDLERFADHRGSSFGGHLNRPPVSQCVFENSIALHQFGKLNRRVVVEDESRYVGRCMIPNPLFHQMKTGPMVQMKIPIGDRIQNIYLEYVKRPLDAGTPASSLLSSLKKSSLALNQSLGSDRVASVIKSLDLAFATESPASTNHHDWISILLVHHYDPAYRRSLQKSLSRITFQGNLEECRQYIETEFDS
jgi:tRNA 2-selenouridine synthase